MTIKITLPDGKIKKYEQEVTGKKLAEDLKIRDVLAIKVNNKVQDLFKPINEDASIKLLKFSDPEGKDVFRHSTAHVFAHAIKHLYPDAKPTIGPPVEEGFYYDFDDLNITPNDFPKIEAKMREIVKNNFPYEYQEVTLEEVKKQFWNNPYKIELAEEFAQEGQKLTIYKEGDFIDLCAGPHIPHTNLIKAIKLTKVAGAYWRSNVKNKQMTRVYGISFPSQKELDDHFKFLEEIEKRDHRKIGAALDLFSVHDIVGGGFPIFHPKGTIVRMELANFISQYNKKLGYEAVFSPHIGKSTLWHQSGHYQAYKDKMFIFHVDAEEHGVKPMSCPFHSQIFKNKVRSYRELPIRYSEFATVYRNEQSGELSGILRVRAITQDDGHAYVMESQIEEEVTKLVNAVIEILKAFGLHEIKINLSTKPEKAIGDEKIWENATNALKNCLEKLKVDYEIKKGEGAFYGPKIDFHVKDAIGRMWQCSTIQVDFFMPERFNLEYIGEDNKQHRPVMIHRALIGSLERFMGILIEHYAGKFPLWLSPEQVRILTIADRFNEYANEVANIMKEKGIRVNVDERSESIGKKIREAQLNQVNYILVVGEKELNDKTVNVRTRDNVVHGAKKVDDLIEQLVEEVKEKKQR